MSRQLIIDAHARADLEGHADYLAHDNLDSAIRFWDMFAEAVSRIQSYPEIGKSWETAHDRLGDIRWWPIPDFQRYLIFYRVHHDRIEVLRVLHGMRDLPAILDDGGR